MRPACIFLLIAPLLILAGCAHHCEKCETRAHSAPEPEPAPAYAEVHSESVDDDDNAVRVWRFPFVQIAIDPDDPRGVGVRVADDESGHEYVNLGVNWDD